MVRSICTLRWVPSHSSDRRETPDTKKNVSTSYFERAIVPPAEPVADNEDESTLWQALGLPEPQLASDQLQAPPVHDEDRDALRLLAKGALKDEAKGKRLWQQIHAYRIWRDAFRWVLIEDA